MAIADYDLQDQIGLGTFGCVYRAKHKLEHSLVAVKVMKESGLDSCRQEYYAMKQLRAHPNIVRLYDAFMDHHKLYFVMELLDGGNLYEYLKTRRQTAQPLPFPQCRNLLRQILEALASMHEQGFAHRDLKPENLLLDARHQTIKLADFGLAKHLSNNDPCTDYVSTRWYRAPEILLRAQHYGTAVDIWSFGTISAEMINLFALFPGHSELDQLNRICHLLGPPTSSHRLSRSQPQGGSWKEGVKLASKLGFRFPQVRGQGLATVFGKDVSPLLIDLMRRCLFFDPNKRLTAHDALQHPYFLVDDQDDNACVTRSASMPPMLVLPPDLDGLAPPVPAMPSELQPLPPPTQRHSSPLMVPSPIPQPRPSVSSPLAKKKIGFTHLFRKKSSAQAKPSDATHPTPTTRPAAKPAAPALLPNDTPSTSLLSKKLAAFKRKSNTPSHPPCQPAAAPAPSTPLPSKAGLYKHALPPLPPHLPPRASSLLKAAATKPLPAVQPSIALDTCLHAQPSLAPTPLPRPKSSLFF
ncbi:Pkinase-domain-containing protein [Hesseltinella vesiculosa]|uniref:Pkinase-domain-containing protein n=1 Tax=Hesseltinella vesiculosa TaxID=101127 RepID=A0A1X2GXH3_9FUNG|nr:Pkinase-domain-containing protein [Hesseltinella vesiculosa]